MHKTICLALTGASGMPYGIRLLECLLAAGCRFPDIEAMINIASVNGRKVLGLD